MFCCLITLTFYRLMRMCLCQLLTMLLFFLYVFISFLFFVAISQNPFNVEWKIAIFLEHVSRVKFPIIKKYHTHLHCIHLLKKRLRFWSRYRGSYTWAIVLLCQCCSIISIYYFFYEEGEEERSSSISSKCITQLSIFVNLLFIVFKVNRKYKTNSDGRTIYKKLTNSGRQTAGCTKHLCIHCAVMNFYLNYNNKITKLCQSRV